MCRGGRCHCLLLLLLVLLLCVVLLLLVAELVLLLLEAAEGMIHETSAPATSYTSTAGRRTLDDLHRQTVGGGAEGLCWRVTGRGRTRKRSHPLDHVRKVHPLGM